MSRNIVIEDRRGHSHRERFLQLQAELRIFSENASPKDYETVLHRFLSEFERLRIDTENQILKLHRELSFCEGTAKSCTTVANTIVSVLRRHYEEMNPTAPKNPSSTTQTEENNEEKTEIVTDRDILKTICICGCQDEEDAANCTCSCHKGIPCDNENCVVCKAKKEQLKAAATKPAKKSRGRPKGKTNTNKKITKKVTNKSKVNKKTTKKTNARRRGYSRL